jgi:glutaredoxin
MLKSYLTKKGVQYEERNVDDNPEFAAEAFEKSGFQMVPVTVVGDRVVMGPNISLLNSILMV